ncbi:MAG: PrgI family protein [Coprococcus sp.]
MSGIGCVGTYGKQLIASILSVLVGGIIVFLTYKKVGLTLSAYIAIPVVAPIALSGFYTYNGMSFMQVMKKEYSLCLKQNRYFISLQKMQMS